MKVLGINCSPRKNSNSAIALAEAMAEASGLGAQVETVCLKDKTINPCDECRSCLKTGKCRQNDDMTGIYDLILAADAIIFATPVFYWGLPGPAKTVIDRLYALGMHDKLAGKVGASLIIASSSGFESTWSQLNYFFMLNHMVRADHVFGFASEPGDVRKDHHAMFSARELGKQVVALAEQEYRFPSRWPKPIYRYVRDQYRVGLCPVTRRFGEALGADSAASETKG